LGKASTFLDNDILGLSPPEQPALNDSFSSAKGKSKGKDYGSPVKERRSLPRKSQNLELPNPMHSQITVTNFFALNNL
jgi:hypothetical protein